jgi:GNAT superfamily N-acetyltransferase
VRVEPLVAERWADFERLFGPRGACAGCWCMFFRQTRKEFEAGKGEANRLAMKAIVEGGEAPGLIAYDGEEPVGWCAVAPRERYSALQRSRNLKPVDEQPVWSVVCFFVAKSHRGRGVTVALLGAAAEYVREQGGMIVEGYPAVAEKELPPVWAYIGVKRAFEKAGFTEVARPSDKKVIMRRYL